MTRLILHVGSEKTGTTSIQNYLYYSRSRLYRAGYVYPAVGMAKGGKSHRALACSFYSEESVDDYTLKLGLVRDGAARVAQKRLLQELASNVLQHPHHVWILSSEHFSSRLRKQSTVDKLIYSLRSVFSDIEVIYYIRDPLSLAVSSWSTEVAQGWLSDQFPSPPDMEYLCDFRGVISRWETSLQASLNVQLYDSSVPRREVLIRNFLAASAIEQDVHQDVPDISLNASLPYQQIILLGALNAKFPPVLVDGTEMTSNPFRRVLKAILSISFSSFPVFIPTEEIRDHYSRHYRESNSWVHARYFHDRPVLFHETLPPTRAHHYEGLSLSETVLVRLFSRYSCRTASRVEYILLKAVVLLFRNYKLIKTALIPNARKINF